MENNENIPQNPIPQQNTPKASPFADSPYVMNHQQEPVYTPSADQEAPVAQPKPRKKGRGKKALKTCIASLLVIALVAAGDRKSVV